jgi:hypothetical protein
MAENGNPKTEWGHKNKEHEIRPTCRKEEELNHTKRSEVEGIWKDHISAKRFRNRGQKDNVMQEYRTVD